MVDPPWLKDVEPILRNLLSGATFISLFYLFQLTYVYGFFVSPTFSALFLNITVKIGISKAS